MAAKETFYVYALFRPWDGSPFYIGKGRGRRWLDHERLGDRHYNPLMGRVFRKAKGAEIPKVKIAENLSERAAFEVEMAFIAALGNINKGGPLVNLTDGGDGSAGRPGALKGKKFTDQHKQRIRESLLGRRHSEEAKAKMSLAVRTRRPPASAETRAKMSAAAKNRAPISEETRSKLRKTAIAFASTAKGKLAKTEAAKVRWSR